LRRARTAARHRVAKQLRRHGRLYREGKEAWTKRHQAWLGCQRLADALAQRALSHMLSHLDAVDAQLAAIDHELEQVATTEPWADPVRWLCSFRGIGLVTALGLLAEVGDFRRFGHPRELMSYLGLTPSEYSSGDQQHRGHITKCGNRHARRLLVEAAWHYQHPPRRSQRARALEPHVPSEVTARAWQAQVRLHHASAAYLGNRCFRRRTGYRTRFRWLAVRTSGPRRAHPWQRMRLPVPAHVRGL
jgi:transposase